MSINSSIHQIQKLKYVDSVYSEDVVDEYKTLVVLFDKNIKDETTISKLVNDVKNIFRIGLNCEQIYSIAENQYSLNINYTNKEHTKNNNTYFIVMTSFVVFFLFLYIYMDLK